VPNGQDATGVDLIFGLALLGTLFLLVRRWRALWDPDFTAEDRRLATQAAIFVVPPVVVLIHELGHLVTARLLGGRVLGFHYGLVEGSVTVAGGLSTAQSWAVALAGNLAGAGLGLAMGVFGAYAVRLPRALRRILILGGLLEVAFQLVGYPLLSLSARFGDWVVIYDFDRTPGLSAVTAVVHVGVLAAVWHWWRSSVRRTLFVVDHGLDADIARLEAAMAASPSDPDPAIQLAVLYAQNGEMSLGRDTLEAAAGNPDIAGPPAARLHLVRARLALIEDRRNQAYLAAQDGLRSLGGGEGPNSEDEVTQRLWANLGLALAAMDKPERALAAFEHLGPPVADDPRILYARGMARIATGDRPAGQADLQSVVGWRPEGDLLRQWAEARLEGREPPPPDDSDRPSYARRTKAPPAPLAGV
jgi:tetratricopeptide (TPR) repeat protein